MSTTGKRSLIWRFAAFVTPMLFPVAAHADSDNQIWAVTNATIDVDAHHYIWLEGEAWITDDASRLGQLFIRPGFGIRLDPSTQLLLGYNYVRTSPRGGPVRNEHVSFEQLGYRLAGTTADHVLLTARTRLEQRLVEGSVGVGVRLRQQVRLSVPVGHHVALVGWTEGFYSFNRTRWGQRPGIDQWRGFVGIRVPAGPHLAIEAGYMNQFLNRAIGDRDNHLASVTLAFRY